MSVAKEKPSGETGGPVDRRRRRRWSEAQKRRIVAESHEPGVSVSILARRYKDGGWTGSIHTLTISTKVRLVPTRSVTAGNVEVQQGSPDPEWRDQGADGLAVEVQGAVKFDGAGRGFGFVVPDHGGREVFVHVSVLTRSGLDELQPGQRVSVRRRSILAASRRPWSN